MPSVSVQIVTYNSENDIEICLKSVFNQSYPIQEVIVIDNQSEDRTLQITREFQGIVHIENNYNNGFAGGHNQGIQHSKADYILVLNPDVVLHEDYIANIISVMEQNIEIGMATGKLYRNFNKRVLDSTGIVMKKNRRAIDRGAGEVDNGQYDDLCDIFGVSGAAAVYRYKMVEDISIDGDFFDETFFAYKEDVDVSWRAQLLGWKCQFVSNATAEHSRGWQEKKKRSDVPIIIRKCSYINRYYYLLKNEQIGHFILHFPFIILYEIPSFLYALLKEREILVAWKSFVFNYKQMLQKRKRIIHKLKKSKKQVYKHFKGIW